MWFPFALSFAITTSFTIILAKKIMKEVDEYTYLWLVNLFTLPYLFLIIVIFFQFPKFDNVFIISRIVGVLIGTIAAILAYRAIRISEVSLVSPISAFNPIFTAIISFSFLSEKITLVGWIGIILVCIGAYILHFSKRNKDFTLPIKKLISNRGIQLSLVAYFLWAITPIFEKISILHTDPQVPPFTSFTGLILSDVIFGVMVFSKSRKSLSMKMIKNLTPWFLLGGLLGGILHSVGMIAFSLTNLGFATAIFKLSMIFSVILGWLFFKEHDIKERLLGSLVMLAGVLLLVM